MGTRGFLGVYVDGQTKGSYNHFDSYPSGLGVDVVTELLNRDPSVDYRQLARDLVSIDSEVPPTQAQKDLLLPYTDLNVSKKSDDDWYCLTRDLQGCLLKPLEIGLYVPSTFYLDSLWCEYAYIWNLDDNTLEVYQGFQDKPHTLGRYGTAVQTLADGEKYYPVALIGTVPVDENLAQAFTDLIFRAFPGNPEEGEDGEGDAVAANFLRKAKLTVNKQPLPTE